jgi:hypothetical protein
MGPLAVDPNWLVGERMAGLLSNRCWHALCLAAPQPEKPRTPNAPPASQKENRFDEPWMCPKKHRNFSTNRPNLSRY